MTTLQLLQLQMPANQPFFFSKTSESFVRFSGINWRDGSLSQFQALIVKTPNLTKYELIIDLLNAYEPANLTDLNYTVNTHI